MPSSCPEKAAGPTGRGSAADRPFPAPKGDPTAQGLPESGPGRPGTADTLLLAWLAGFSAALGQILFFRESLAAIGGNEAVLSLLFLLWFAGMGAGALAGGAFRLRAAGAARLSRFALPLLCAAGWWGTAVLRQLRDLAGTPPGQVPGLAGALPAMALGIVPFAALAGLLLPTLAGAASASAVAAVRRNPGGWVYGFDTAGCLAGGIFFTFALGGHGSPFVLFWACFCLSGLAGAALPLARREAARAVPGCVTVALGVGLWLGGVPARLDNWSAERRWSSLAPGYERTADEDSPYGRITLGFRQGQFALYVNGLSAAVFPDPVGDAMTAHLFMNQAPSPRRVLLAGNGLEGLLGHVLAYPVRQATLLYSDPVILETVRKSLGPAGRRALDDPRLRLVEEDAARFLRRSTESFDVILLNPPPPVSAAGNRFYSREFFASCRQRLTPRGVLGVGLPGDENYLGPELRATVGTLDETLRTVFPEVAAIPGPRFLFFASGTPGVVTLSPAVLARRYAANGLAFSDDFTPWHFVVALAPERTPWGREALAAIPFKQVNTYRDPVLYFHHLRLWNLSTDSRVGPLLQAAGSFRPWHLLGSGLAVAVLGALVARLPRYRRGAARHLPAAAAGIALLGFTGMGTEILLLYQFQIFAGSLYSQVGLLTALFMAGTTAGSLLFSRPGVGRKGRTERTGPAFFLGLPLLAAAVALSLTATVGATVAFLPEITALQSVLAGAAVGGAFPLGCRLFARAGRRPDSAAAWLSALDFAGAMAGACLTGLAVLPALGSAGTGLALAGLVLAVPLGAALCGLSRRGHA